MTQYSDSTLTIHLDRISSNYSILSNISKAKSECAAAVKANAYGLGIKEVSLALKKSGCNKFFVATLDEAIELREILPEVDIYVLNGIGNKQNDIFGNYKLIPVLNSKEQINQWADYTKSICENLPSIIHVDTGINRLGISYKEFNQVIQQIDINKSLNVKYIMSHLACADDPNHELNKLQLERVNKISHLFPDIKISLANSCGIFLGNDYHFDLLRPGISLYGGNPTPGYENPMEQVISLKSNILQIRKIDSSDRLGYGATANLPKGGLVAVIAIGYADGYQRSLSNKGKCFIDGKIVPILGRVSMDMSIIDVSSLPENSLYQGKEVEIIGDNITIDDIASDAGTISYEILTQLGSRFRRVYR
ncbi:alanine racemase [Rickettsiales bacterium]|nr:alanine racemase [Rickettsiales bacterium]